MPRVIPLAVEVDDVAARLCKVSRVHCNPVVAQLLRRYKWILENLEETTDVTVDPVDVYELCTLLDEIGVAVQCVVSKGMDHPSLQYGEVVVMEDE